MFLGHFGVGMAAKSASKEVSLGTLFLAAQFIDLLWPTLLLLGLESVVVAPGSTKLTPLEFTHYPISHSLLAVLGWSLGFAAVYYGLRRAAKPALLCAALVASHWFLDALTHKPDLLLFPGGSTKIGLGLWNHPPAAIAVEAGLFFGGVFLYLRSTAATSKAGRPLFWSLMAFLIVVQLGNLFGPVPPSALAVAWTSQAQWLLVAWGYWVDQHHEARGA